MSEISGMRSFRIEILMLSQALQQIPKLTSGLCITLHQQVKNSKHTEEIRGLDVNQE